ncbi:MAG: hypothetical protein JWL63_1520 [Rhodocyclales bacterium]|nr:hypothetical protein [Rhodocyclales bacterium]
MNEGFTLLFLCTAFLVGFGWYAIKHPVTPKKGGAPTAPADEVIASLMRARSAINDALMFVEQSEQRIAALEAEHAERARVAGRGGAIGT